MSEVAYLAVLKGKPAEFGALAEADTAVKGGAFPLVEVIPPDHPASGADIEAAIAKAVTTLARSWSGEVALDTWLLDRRASLPSRRTLAEHAHVEALSHGLRVTPVLRLDSSPAEVAGLARIVRSGVTRAVVRVGDADLNKSPATVDTELNALAASIGLPPSSIDLVLDFGAVGGGAYVREVRHAAGLINGIHSISAWSRVFLASGAFPRNLAGVPTGGTGLLPRDDWKLWEETLALGLSRVPDFGDYAIQHPELPPSGGRAIPQLRYTLHGDWRIRKGRMKDPRGHAQFYDLCHDHVASGEFSGRTLSWGDARIEDAAASHALVPPLVKTGNATTWRQVGTSHHLAYVVNQLATTPRRATPSGP